MTLKWSDLAIIQARDVASFYPAHQREVIFDRLEKDVEHLITLPQNSFPK